VGLLAGPAGIDQFLDIGAGLPACGPVHEVARAVNPQARVVYADNDPVVAAHARAILAEAPGIAAVKGDVRRPLDLLTTREVRDVINFDRPVGILLVAVLHFVSDDDDPWHAVRCITDRLAPGSYLVISHVTGDALSDAAVKAVSEIYQSALASGTARSRSEITRFFGGIEVIEPGVVDVARWRRRARGRSAPPVLFYAGVGRKGEGRS
jgi:SAM-dependent methyltransferase